MDAKKKRLRASEVDQERIQQLRHAYVKWARDVDPERLVFIDEAGSNIAMTRERAWAPVGEFPDEAVPRNRGTVTTMIGALTIGGLTAMMTIEGGTSADVGSVRSLAQTAYAQVPLRRREEWVHPSQINNLHGRCTGRTKEYPCPRRL